MVKSFSSWTQINELFGRGSVIAHDSKSNVRQKMVWKVQDNSSFLVKLIRMPNFIDGNGNLTPDAIEFITKNLNSEQEFVKMFHSLTPEFFKSAFFVYTIVKNTDNRDKVQFKMLSRSEYPGLPANVNFVDSNTVNQYLKPEEEPIVIQPDDDDEEPVVIDTDDDKKKEEQDKEPVKVSDDEKSSRKFIYLMRTNNVEYLMEFTPDFKKIAAKANKVGGTDGDVSYDQKSDTLPWNAEEGSLNLLDVLKSDTVITNGYDKNFLKKMFTDEAFRKKVLDEYIAKYGNSEINETSIKKMLYHRSGSLIFAEAAPEPTVDSTGATTNAPDQGISADALTAGLKNLFGATTQSTTTDASNITTTGLETPNTI
jgi:hypothetical protein